MESELNGKKTGFFEVFPSNYHRLSPISPFFPNLEERLDYLKKTAAIFLGLVLLFNIIGYRLIFSVMENNSTARLEKKIDAGDYSDAQLLEIRIPLKVPYISDSRYETCYGETEFEGQHYRYVKRKVTSDTLYLLCISHQEKDHIVAARTGFMKAVNDVGQNNGPEKSSQPSYVKMMLSEFIQEQNVILSCYASFDGSEKMARNFSFISQFNPHPLTEPPDAGDLIS
jgi:hypothetical protein